MKISFVDDEPEIYPLQYGGKARTVLGLAKSALSFDVVEEVTIMSRSIHGEVDDFTDSNGINFRTLNDRNLIGSITQEALDADIISIHTCSTTFPLIPPENRNASLIYHLHDVMLATSDKGSHLDKALAGDWDVIVSPSNFASRTYENFSATIGTSAEIRTIPRGIDTTLFHPVPKNEALKGLEQVGISLPYNTGPVLYFPGRADVGKGDDQIQIICESLSRIYPDFLVVTASDADAYRQHPNVLHLGWQDSSILKFIYSIADVTVALSKLPESFSQVCIESIACGTAVLAFPFGNLPELSQALPAINVCEPTTEDILAVLHNILATPGDDTSIIESQTTIKSEYDIEQIGKTYIQLYKDVAKRRNNQLKVPKVYFISPFVTVHRNAAYISDSDNSPIQQYTLTKEESLVLSRCTNAVTIEEIILTTGLNSETIMSNLRLLIANRVLIGANNDRNLAK